MQYDDRGTNEYYDVPPILYTLTDASYNVVGLATETGLYRQYRYELYGSFTEAGHAQDYSGGIFDVYPIVDQFVTLMVV